MTLHVTEDGLYGKWHLDPCNRLATYTDVTDRQDIQTTVR